MDEVVDENGWWLYQNKMNNKDTKLYVLIQYTNTLLLYFTF